MVFFFTSNTFKDEALIFMGSDMYENEDLIKYSFPKDVWFRVESFDSKHFFLRLPGLKNIDKVPSQLLEEISQLAKEYSKKIGKKKKEVRVLYTFAENLLIKRDHKQKDVAFKELNAKRYVKRVRKDRDILIPIRRSKREECIDLKELYSKHMSEIYKAEQFVKSQYKSEEIRKEKRVKQQQEQKIKEMEEF